MLTLRQIEVVRAIMVAGTVKGAADLLGVSAPGISRVMKHTESQLGLRLFARTHGRYVPTEEARDIFDQISEVFKSVGNLECALEDLKAGGKRPVSFAAVPSISSHVFPAAIKRLRGQFPNLQLHLNILKIEEAIDYLLLNKGEMAVLSYKLDHPGLAMELLYSGRLVAAVHADHLLARESAVSVTQLANESLIGIDPGDPYGSILAAPFRENDISLDYSIQARTGQMMMSLVAEGLGVSVIDELSVAGPARQPAVKLLPIKEPTRFRAFAAFNAQRPRSIFSESMVTFLKAEMKQVSRSRQKSDQE